MSLRLTILTFLLTCSISIFGQTAEDFKITTTDNEAISLYTNYLDKGKSVVIELFFVDCPSCRNFAPFMTDLHTQMLERDIQVEFISLSVSSRDNDETINGFKNEFKHDWPYAHFAGGSEAASKPYTDGTYGQYFGTPTVAVISPDRTVNYVKRVFNNEGYIEVIETAIIASQTAFNENNEPATATISGGINTLKGEGLGGVTVNFSGAKDTSIVTGADGSFQTGSLLVEESYTIALEKDDDPTNGVTTFDIIFISKHILGIETFTTSQEMIAADVNNSGGVTTFDIVQIRQLILGVISEFPNNTSWVFEPEEVQLSSLTDLGTLSFTGIKIGDLNQSANASGLVAATDRERKEALTLWIADQYVSAGEQVRVQLDATNLSTIQGFQFTLAFEPNALLLNDLEIGALSNYSVSNFNVRHKERGLISTSWDTRNEQNSTRMFTLNFTAQQSGRLSEFVQVNSDLTSAVAYDWNADALDVKLAFTDTSKRPFTEANLYPNPSSSNTTFMEISTNIAKAVDLRIIDITGKILLSIPYSLKEGTQIIPVSTAKFASGIYTLQLSEGNKTLKTMRLVKQ